MSRPTSEPRESPLLREHASRTTFAAFVGGIPLGLLFLALIYFGPLHNTALYRYFTHPVEVVEVILFGMALAALSAKLLANLQERRAVRQATLPAWDGKCVPTASAKAMLEELEKQPRSLHGTLMVRRVARVLDFVRSRGSAAELDDQLRTLADNDAMALEGSYALTRFITWAMPILGFLGTVLGITTAIAGVTPEVLEHSLSSVTDGLALAFDTTALALGLTMATMFYSFLVERAEQGILEAVDRYVDRELAHRFDRPTANQFGAGVDDRVVVAMVEATEGLVRKQAEIWAATLEQVDRRRLEADTRLQQEIGRALQSALDTTLEAHSRRAVALEQQVLQHCSGLVDRLNGLAIALRDTAREQQQGAAQITARIAEQTQALADLRDGEHQVLQLQSTLQDNLQVLAGVGTFEQAVHSLTAAIHLLTARSSATATAVQPRIGQTRPGAAA